MDYSRKYKKYKLKYLNLRSTLVGGDFGKLSSIPTKTPSDMLMYLTDNNGKFDENLFSSYILNYMRSVIQTPNFLKATDIPFYIPLVSAFHKYNRDVYRAEEFDNLMISFLGFVGPYGKDVADAKLVDYWEDIILKRKEGNILIYPKISLTTVAPKIPTQPIGPIVSTPSTKPQIPIERPITQWKRAEPSKNLSAQITTQPVESQPQQSTEQPQTQWKRAEPSKSVQLVEPKRPNKPLPTPT